MDKKCKHVWCWQEKNYVNGYPMELDVWCEKCGEKKQLVMVGPIAKDKLTPELSSAPDWNNWLREFREKYGVL